MKERSSPLKQIGLERLLQRLPHEHSKYTIVESALRTTRAGNNGERILADVFQKYQFPFEHYVFHDLCLRSTGRFQIDTLILCRQGAIILEMKNIAGRISFPHEQNQITRLLENGQLDSFECPSIQLERNQILFEDWLHARNISVPVYKAVVFPRPQQYFDNYRRNLTILFPLEIPVYLRNIDELTPTLDSKQLRKIATALVESHREFNPFPLTSTYTISPTDLTTGVQCKKCGFFGMHSIHRGWGCLKCKQFNSDEHIQALLDYFMLISNRITNKECRSFLRLDNSQKAQRILAQLEIPTFSERRGRYYLASLQDIDSLVTKLIDDRAKVLL